MATLPEDKASGDLLNASEVNALRDMGYIVDINAGETINGATVPVAVYFDDTANEWLACDANVTTKLAFAGFAISNGTDGNPIQVQVSGKVGGFSGLTVGNRYYVSDTQTIVNSPGTYYIPVGVAVSATEILMMRNDQAEKNVVPIGGIIAWAKSITGMPSLPVNFVECTGQTLSDSESPLDGQVMPDLNGGEFLRGSTTSGGTGGAATVALTVAEMPSHTHGLTRNFSGGNTLLSNSNDGFIESGTEGSSGTTDSTGSGTAHENLPPYYNVVYVMRVK